MLLCNYLPLIKWFYCQHAVLPFLPISSRYSDGKRLWPAVNSLTARLLYCAKVYRGRRNSSDQHLETSGEMGLLVGMEHYDPQEIWIVRSMQSRRLTQCTEQEMVEHHSIICPALLLVVVGRVPTIPFPPSHPATTFGSARLSVQLLEQTADEKNSSRKGVPLPKNSPKRRNPRIYWTEIQRHRIDV